MRNFSTVLILLSATVLSAQPVLDHATVLPAIGTTYSREWHYLSFNAPVLPVTGGPLIWDLGASPMAHYGIQDTVTVVDPMITPAAASFPAATNALHSYRTNPFSSPLLAWYFSAASPDSFAVIGYADNMGLLDVIDPPRTNIPLPLNLNDGWYNFDSTFIGSYSAFGSIIAPWGDTIPDVVFISWFSLNNNYFTYSWYQSGNLLDQLGNYDPDFGVIQLYRRIPIANTQVPEHRPLEIFLAPNPASDHVRVDCPSLRYGHLRLSDPSGRVFLETPISHGPNTIPLNMAPGTYIMEITEKLGTIGRTRLIVQ